jgi:hypothetical protein
MRRHPLDPKVDGQLVGGLVLVDEEERVQLVAAPVRGFRVGPAVEDPLRRVRGLVFGDEDVDVHLLALGDR